MHGKGQETISRSYVPCLLPFSANSQLCDGVQVYRDDGYDDSSDATEVDINQVSLVQEFIKEALWALAAEFGLDWEVWEHKLWGVQHTYGLRKKKLLGNIMWYQGQYIIYSEW